MADTHGLGPCAFTSVRVQVSPSAQKESGGVITRLGWARSEKIVRIIWGIYYTFIFQQVVRADFLSKEF